MSVPQVTLYGAPASLYTGKVRSWLRKNGVTFEERFQSHPRYRDYVRGKADGNHRVPIVELADGTVIQESTVILDELEKRFPSKSAPMGPRQMLVNHLFECFGERAFLPAAMHYRWSFPDENMRFIVGEFGRILRAGAEPPQIEEAGKMIAGRMSAYLPGLGITAQTIALVEKNYLEALAILNEHLSRQPYLLGGLPARADYALMAPLYAHLARDPYPARLMKQQATLVYRWTERMNAPELASPEFPDTPTDYGADDEVPQTMRRFLALMFETWGVEMTGTAKLFDAWAEKNKDAPAGTFISPEGTDQPSLGRLEVTIRGVTVQEGAPAHSLWVLQRALDYYVGLGGVEKAACDALLRETGGEAVMAITLPRRLTRRQNKLAVA